MAAKALRVSSERTNKPKKTNEIKAVRVRAEPKPQPKPIHNRGTVCIERWLKATASRNHCLLRFLKVKNIPFSHYTCMKMKNQKKLKLKRAKKKKSQRTTTTTTAHRSAQRRMVNKDMRSHLQSNLPANNYFYMRPSIRRGECVCGAGLRMVLPSSFFLLFFALLIRIPVSGLILLSMAVILPI